MNAHLQLIEEEFSRQGLTPEEARVAARRKFGSIAQTEDLHRDARSFVWLDDARRDVRFASRILLKHRGYSAVIVLTLALGIGATTTIFSIAYGVLMRPLPWDDAQRLVRLTETRDGRTGRVTGTITNGTFLAWRENPATLDGLGGWLTQTATLTGTGDPIRLPIVPATPTLFSALRVRPLLGRLFADGEGATGLQGVALLSYSLWRERFGGRSEVVGQLIQLDGKPFTVVGVMPPDFAFPDRETRVWTAWAVPAVVGESGVLRGVIFRAIGRLRAGVTAAQATAEGTARARNSPDMGFAARALFGAVGPIQVTAVPEIEATTADVRPALLVLFGAAALLLLTAISNVASLQLARAVTRQREMAVRAAVGAGRRRIARQLLIENVLAASCGGAAGLLLTAGLIRMLPSLLPEGFPRLDAVWVDLRVYAFAFAASVAASIACGMMSAWSARRVNLTETLAEGAAPVGAAIRSPTGRARVSIMVSQVAVACVLLVGAVLFTRSFLALIRADRGFDPVNVLTARLPLPPGYPAERRGQLLEALTERLRAVPGVTHAAYGTALPFLSLGGFTAFDLRSPGNPDVEVKVQAAQRVVSPDYFDAMRLRLVAGRTLADADTAASPPAVVVNRTFARQYLGDHAVGFHIPQRGPRAGGIRFPDEHADWEIVGVVEDMRQDADAPMQPEIFASMKQVAASTANVGLDPIVVIRTTANPAGYASTLKELLHQQAPTLALDSVMTMEDRVATSLTRPRLYAIVLTSFGVSAVAIAAVGIFGVLSFSAAQRRVEIGIRCALGAQMADIVTLVLRQAALIVAVGVAVGLAAALVSMRVLSAFLYGVTTYDAITFTLVPVVVAVVSAIACFVPARRAASVDPLVALRG